ncbi:MAG: carboxypeptidase-like regulatory domain-containing protein [Chitinophagia bacterium]|jgi:hypothetical protein
MTKRPIFAVLAILMPVLIFGQSISIQGVVLDSLTNKPLSGVAVTLSNYKGTITNSQGFFHLRSELYTAGKTPKLSISYVGYRPMFVSVLSTKEPIEIRLAPIQKELKEVIVSSKTKSIIERAIDKIPENYPVNSVIINGLLRVNVSVNDTDYFYKSDALAQIYAQSYNNGIDQRVEVLQNKTRTIKNPQSKYSAIAPASFVGNFSSIADIVYHKGLFLNKRLLNDYIYFHYTKAFINNRVTYIIEFEKKRNNKIEGTVYIDSASLAFVKFNVKRYKVQSLMFATKDFENVEVNYRQYGDKWIINDSYQETIYNMKFRAKEYVGFAANSYDTSGTKKISTYAANGSFDLDDKVQRFVDDSLWRRNEKLFEKAENESRLSIVEMPKIDTTLHPIKFGFSVAMARYFNPENIRFRLYGVQFPYSLNKLGYNLVAAYGIGAGASFRIYKTLFLQLNREFNYGWGGLKISCSSYRLSYLWSLNGKSNRSLVAAPFIGYSGIQIDDKSKNLQQRFTNAVSGLTLYVPASKQLQFFAEGEYNYTLKNRPATLSIQFKPLSLKAGLEFKF